MSRRRALIARACLVCRTPGAPEREICPTLPDQPVCDDCAKDHFRLAEAVRRASAHV